MDNPQGIIRHYATVLKVNRHNIVVRTEEASPQDCGGCHLAGMCGQGGRSEIKLRVSVNSPRVVVGQRVLLTADGGTRGAAVLWTLGLPAAIFLSMILGLTATGLDGWVVALTALAAVGVYFLLLGMVQPHIFKREIWSITPVEK